VKKQPAKQELQHLTEQPEGIAEKYRNLYDSLHESTAFIELSKELAVTANEAETSTEALRNCIDRVARFMGWPVGHVYFTVTEPKPHMVPSGIWYLQQPRKFSTFKKVTEKTPFDLGKGLPGRILKSKKPAWIIDVMKDKNFPRNKMANDLGVKAGFGFPVLVKKEVVAVMEFFAEEAIEPDHRLLELMEQIGTQLGRIMEREELVVKNERLDSFMNSATDHFVILDKDLNVIEINEEAVEYFQAPKEELLGMNITELSPDVKESGRYDKYLEVIKTGEPFFVNDLVSHPSLGYLHLNVKAFKVGEGLGIIASDITGMREAIDELTNFMYRVSHDLKSPLATLMGLANLAAKESGTDRDQYIGMMCDQATKMDGIFTDLVELTRVKQGEITPTLIDLPALCTDAINSTSHTKGFEQVTINANWELKKNPIKPLYSSSCRTS